MQTGKNHFFMFLRSSAFCFSLFLSLLSYGQESPDSIQTDSTFLSVFSESSFLRDTTELSKPAKFELFQRYQPQYESFPFMRVGNVGHAQYSPMLSYLTRPTDLTRSVSYPFFSYYDQRENINYYRNKPPFTVLSYHSGAKKEEGIDVIHARNFGRNLNFSVHLDRNGSEGFYNNLETRGSFFNTNINYATANHRYMLLTHYYVNRKTVDENGGFEDFNSIENPETVGSTRLDNANNDAQEEAFFISQNFGFGNTADEGAELIRPVFRLGHDLQLVRGYRKYEDLGNFGGLNTSFYDNIYYDSTRTLDTNRYEKISNQANIYFYPGSERFKFYYRNDLIKYSQNQTLDTIYTDHIAGTELAFYLFRKEYKTNLSADYVFDGFRQGDLDIKVDFRKRKVDTSKNPSVITSFYYDLTNPQYKQLHYNSNNFIWSNSFNKTQRWGFRAGASWKGYSLNGDFGFLSNYIYYNNEALPEQFGERFSYLNISASKFLHWKNIHLDNKIVYQTTESTVLPVSNWMFYESLYYENLLFKKVLLYRIGIDLYYFTGYKAMAYNPAIAQFHLQDRQTIGNYPFIDLFITFQLKRAFFFLKIEHFNKGMAGDNFYNIPDYPVPPRAFKWGIKWTLFD